MRLKMENIDAFINKAKTYKPKCSNAGLFVRHSNVLRMVHVVGQCGWVVMCDKCIAKRGDVVVNPSSESEYYVSENTKIWISVSANDLRQAAETYIEDEMILSNVTMQFYNLFVARNPTIDRIHFMNFEVVSGNIRRNSTFILRCNAISGDYTHNDKSLLSLRTTKR